MENAANFKAESSSITYKQLGVLLVVFGIGMGVMYALENTDNATMTSSLATLAHAFRVICAAAYSSSCRRALVVGIFLRSLRLLLRSGLFQSRIIITNRTNSFEWHE